MSEQKLMDEKIAVEAAAPEPQPRGVSLIQVITIAVFILSLAAPALQSSWKIFDIKPLDENRYRARPPVFDWRAALDPAAPYSRELETYFNDHYGFRDLLIRSKNQIDYSLFHRSDELVLGSGGYWFYRAEVVDLERRWAEEELRDIFWRNLDLTRGEFEKHGMKFVVLICPNKNTIYPEKVPSWAIRRPKDLALFKFQRGLKERGYLTMSPYDTLMSNKSTGRLYHKTDFHWNEAGAAYVAKDLVNYLAAEEGLGEIWKSEIVTRAQEGFSGGQNRSLATFSPPPEVARVYVHQGTPKCEIKYQDGPYRFTSRRYQHAEGPALPNTVIIGDSFAELFFQTGFPNYFKRLAMFSYPKWRETPPVPADTKIVILCVLEPSLDFFIRDQGRRSVWAPVEALVAANE